MAMAPGRVQRTQDLEARAIGQVHVQQHEIGPDLLGEAQRFGRGVRLRHDGEALEPLHVRAMNLGDAEIVLDDEHADHRETAASDGRSAVNTAPPSLVTRSHPPRRCATWRTRAVRVMKRTASSARPSSISPATVWSLFENSCA